MVQILYLHYSEYGFSLSATPKTNLVSPMFPQPRIPQPVCPIPVRPVFPEQHMPQTDACTAFPYEQSAHNSASTSPKLVRSKDSHSSCTDVKTVDSHQTNPKYLDSCAGDSETNCKEIATSSLCDSGIEENQRLHSCSDNQEPSANHDEVNSGLLEGLLDDQEDSETEVLKTSR